MSAIASLSAGMVKPSPGQMDLANKFGYLRSFGYNTHSFLSLYPAVKHFALEGVDGYIPYVSTNRLLLVSGEPVCSPAAFQPLVNAMRAQAIARNLVLGMLPVGEASKQRLESMGFDVVYIGKEPIFDLKALPKLTSSIRQAVNRAQRRGLKVLPFDEKYRQAFESMCRQWQDTRQLPAMQFLFQLRPLELLEHKKYFLLTNESEELLAFLACSPIYARNGWYLEDLIRDQKAPNGGTELLVTAALDSLSADGFDMATLALAPLAGLPGSDETHPILNSILRFCYRKLSFLYHFQTLEYFKAKFQPNTWENNYFCFYPGGVTLNLVCNLIEAFMPFSLSEAFGRKVQEKTRA